MADGDKYSRTEKPTPKRKKDARDEGRVARSPEIGGWLAMLASTMLLPWLLSAARSRVVTVTGAAANVMAHPTAGGALAVLESGLRQFLTYAAMAGGAFMALGVVASVAQVGRAASFKAARPRLSHISPKAGFQRLFAPTAAWDLLKQLLKLAIVAAIGYSSIRGLIGAVSGRTPVTLGPLLDYAGSSIVSFVRVVAVIGLALGAADWGVQRHRLSQSLKMTKHEVKEERRSQEGDPAVRARLLRQSYSIARSRMMAAVKTADVVVANPTHYAVALQYDPSGSGAPRVVAKGVDGLALRIREEAARHGVAVVEDPPLARYLHGVCDIDQQIPVAVYIAVARLIAFVYSLSPVTRGIGIHRRPHSVVPEIEPGTPPPGIAAARRRRRVPAAAASGAS